MRTPTRYWLAEYSTVTNGLISLLRLDDMVTKLQMPSWNYDPIEVLTFMGVGALVGYSTGTVIDVAQSIGRSYRRRQQVTLEQTAGEA